MKFVSTTIAGTGRGKQLGFPTLNLIVPDTLPSQLKQGVYAARVLVDGGERYVAALYYGPASSFGETEARLEVYLIDAIALYVQPGTAVEVEVRDFIREPKQFTVPELLIAQMTEDVAQVQTKIH
jgi:riboflavin kinase/FMN adenylyltransferase